MSHPYEPAMTGDQLMSSEDSSSDSEDGEDTHNRSRLLQKTETETAADGYNTDSEPENETTSQLRDDYVLMRQSSDGFAEIDIDVEGSRFAERGAKSPLEPHGQLLLDTIGARYWFTDGRANRSRTRGTSKVKDLTGTNGCQDEFLLQFILKNRLKPLAPPLNDNLQFHVFFLYHGNDREWTQNVMSKLESPPLGFQCCCHERDFDYNSGSLRTNTHVGIKNAQKTVLVLSPDFVADVWSSDDLQLLSEMDVLLIQKDLIVVLLQECDVPLVLSGVACVDTVQEDWWGKMLAYLISSDLQSGHLLHSAKSRCRCCGKEVVDPLELPDELLAHGIQISPEEYRSAIGHLMVDVKFRCHVCCYNVPAALVFFTLLLGLCLAVIPLIEAKLVFHGRETGLEFVHAGVAWLCALTLYMLLMQISKRRMKGNTYKRLTFVNTILIKYNLLAGVENLGLADCNKYYLHFFYFEIGPCLAYLQELMVNIEEYSACFRNQTAESGDVTIEMEPDDTLTGNTDQSRVLNTTNLTNRSMQTQAEELILQHSGEYISMLITKRIERPRRMRHVRDSLCLCQFVEQRVYKMVV